MQLQKGKEPNPFYEVDDYIPSTQFDDNNNLSDVNNDLDDYEHE